jgi:hypothetical protein
MKPVTVILPSYCPDDTVKQYETECLRCLGEHTASAFYDLMLMQGGDRSYPQKVNEAVRESGSPYIVILSNDVFVGPRWLEYLVRDFEAVPRCGIMAPVEHEAPGQITYNDHWWACVLTTRKAWNDVGPLDETLPATYHDQDWSIRAKQKGYEICRTGNVAVRHIGMATRSRVQADDSWEREEMVRRWGVSEFRDWLNL